MNSIIVPLCMNVEKKYNIIKTKFKNSIYNGDTNWIAYWFYTQYDPNADNITIKINGDFHQTYPNPQHLSIEIINPGNDLSNKYKTPLMHISKDDNNYGYVQELENLYYSDGVDRPKK